MARGREYGDQGNFDSFTLGFIGGWNIRQRVTLPECIIVDIVTWCNFDCSSPEGGVHQFCVGDDRQSRTWEEGMADTFVVKMLSRVIVN